MQEVGSHLVYGVKDQQVLPNHNCHADRSRAHDVIDFKPYPVVGKEEVLGDHTEVDEVAEVEHEELALLGCVVHIAPHHKEYHESCVECRELVRIPEEALLAEDNGQNHMPLGSKARLTMASLIRPGPPVVRESCSSGPRVPTIQAEHAGSRKQTSFFRWFAANIGWFVDKKVVQYYAPSLFVLFL